MSKCGARNGTYVCQFEHGPDTRHAGMHYAYFISGETVKVAEWVDHYGKVFTRTAPVPPSISRTGKREEEKP